MTPDILGRKAGDKIVVLTAYHTWTARIVDDHCDVILVGGSLGDVLYGFSTALPVRQVVEAYAADVRCGAFPAPQHVYDLKIDA